MLGAIVLVCFSPAQQMILVDHKPNCRVFSRFTNFMTKHRYVQILIFNCLMGLKRQLDLLGTKPKPYKAAFYKGQPSSVFSGQ